MERQQCRSTTTASVGDFNDRLFVCLENASFESGVSGMVGPG